jgi:3-oxoacyl-[acyl-carrier protein] reductase
MRHALITGGEGDLARSLAAQLRDAGWQVHAPGRNSMDVTRRDQIESYLATLPRIDLLVNNAAIVADALAVTMALESFHQVLETNLKGSFLCSQVVLKRMSKQHSGHIVNVGSFAALSGTAGQANYAAAKAGLIGLTQSVAKEYGSRGIRCNCILPGFMETKMTRAVSEQRRADVLAEHCLGRFTSPDEAARFIVQLESFPTISGQVFQLDSRVGGWT